MQAFEGLLSFVVKSEIPIPKSKISLLTASLSHCGKQNGLEDEVEEVADDEDADPDDDDESSDELGL